MLVPKGSIVDIDGIQGVLTEDITINLKSNFRLLASDFQNEITQMMDIAGAATRSLSGGQLGFSSQFKQMTTQIWDKTDPARFSMNVEFHRVPFSKNSGPQDVSGKNVMDTVKQFCSIPLPAELEGGMLVPPGPSPIEGIGLDALKGGAKGANVSGYVNITIGSMKFHRILMEGAEPTFSKYVDDSGYPISCRVAFTFVSVWAATKSMVKEWFE
jgi:hypothetical protein